MRKLMLSLALVIGAGGLARGAAAAVPLSAPAAVGSELVQTVQYYGAYGRDWRQEEYWRHRRHEEWRRREAERERFRWEHNRY